MLDDLYHDINDIRVHAQYAAEREYRICMPVRLKPDIKPLIWPLLHTIICV